MPDLLTSAYRLLLAEEARSLAQKLHDPAAQRMMLLTAAGYKRMARHADTVAETQVPQEGNIGTNTD
jgi:hypothetical protein